MLKKVAIAALLAIASAYANAQYSVQAQVNDDSGSGVPYATARIYSAHDTSKVVATGVASESGLYRQELKAAGKYVAKFTSVGMMDEARPFEVSDTAKAANLGAIVMKTAANTLKSVEVSAMAPLIKNDIDRISYNVQNDDDSKTANALDMLRKVPLVTIDAQDQIRVKGGTSFKIFKNGHPDPTISSNPKEVLKAIPASMIKRIEVITEPGAKYDAEGVTAILNIVTVDDAQVNGATGTVGAGVNNNGKFDANGYLTAQLGKVVVSGNYGYVFQGKSANKNRIESNQDYVSSGERMSNSSTSTGKANVHYGSLQASYEPDSLNLFTLSGGGFAYDVKGDAHVNTTRFNSELDTLYNYSSWQHIPKQQYSNVNGRFDYEHRTHVKDETLTFSYMLSASRSNNRSHAEFADMVNMPVPYNGYEESGKEKFTEHTFQLDWTRPFAKYHKIETGLKYIYRRNTSHNFMNYDDYEDGDTETRFRHLTQVAAAYASYLFQRGSFSARAGVRYEYSYLKASYPDGSQAGFHRSLNDVVPNANLQYRFNMANSLTLSYAASINRPGINYLNPAVVDRPTSISYGNAGLSSSRNHLLSASFMHTGTKFTFNVSPNFSYSNDGITNVNFVRDGKDVSTYDNVLRNLSAGGSCYVQWQVLKGTSLMLNANVYYNSLKNANLGLQQHRVSLLNYAQVTQQLPWKLRLTANVGEWGGSIGDVYSHGSSTWFCGFGLQRSFMKEDRLTVRLSANNPFSGKFHRYTSYTTQGDYTGRSAIDFVSREFGINVSYRFGSIKARVKQVSRSIENNDVVGGISNGGGSQGGQSQQGGLR